jgi:hypothetical protein
MMPHEPQFVGSVIVLTHTPLHVWLPAGQPQALFAHA